MTYQLMGSPKTRAFRVLWMLEELGEDYEFEPTAPHSEPINAINPSGKIPALLVDGQPVLDSIAIIQFLADRHKRFTYPAGTIERARQDSFTQFAADEFEGACWNHFKHSFVLPETLRVEEAKPAFAHDFANAAKAFEARLGDNDFVMGEEFTVPDLLLGHLAGWGKACGYEWPQGRITEYFKRVRSRPAYRRAVEIRDAA